MNQQFIVNITDSFYPFAEIQQPKIDSKIFIRRIIYYRNKQQYKKLKDKIQLVKNLKHPYLVKLLNVLEGEGVFHLVYDYVFHKLNKSTFTPTLENIKKLSSKLNQLFSVFYENNIQSSFSLKNLGLNDSNQPKYFLDIEQLQMASRKQILKDNISKIQKSLLNYYNSRSAQPHTQSLDGNTNSLLNPKQNLIKKSQVQSSNSSDSKQANYLRLNSQAISKKKVNALQILNIIEQRLEELKRTTKYNPKMRETFQLNEILRETVKEKWQKEKIKTRKMSGNTTFDAPDPFKESELKRNMTSVKSNIFQDSNSNITNITKPNQEQTKTIKTLNKNQTKEKKNISHKNHFDDLKKQSFQKYTNSKKSYVQEFLDILGDDSERQQYSLPDNKKNFSQNNEMTQPSKQNSSIKQNNQRQTNEEQSNCATSWKQRINKAIKNTNTVLQNYTKSSQSTVRMNGSYKK